MSDQENEKPAASVKRVASENKGRKAKMIKVALQTPYTLVNPYTGVRFALDTEVECEEDKWVKANLEAKLLKQF